eukprot:scaffold99874_cov41-Tisochrysis_lutea.AAC.2
MCQIYVDGGRLRDLNGNLTDTYIQIVLTADKPALCKILVLGRRTFSHDAFSPCCGCQESKGQFYDLSMDPLTHYGSMTFEKRCALALIAPHEALNQAEPKDWTILRDDGVKLARRPPPQPRASARQPAPRRRFRARSATHSLSHTFSICNILALLTPPSCF